MTRISSSGRPTAAIRGPTPTAAQAFPGRGLPLWAISPACLPMAVATGDMRVGVSPLPSTAWCITVYAQHGAGSDSGDVYYIRSTDRGQTFSAPLKLNSDATIRPQ